MTANSAIAARSSQVGTAIAGKTRRFGNFTFSETAVRSAGSTPKSNSRRSEDNQMAFTIEYTEFDELKIKTNDEGEWTRADCDYTNVFVGFGGENIVVVQFCGMQSGTVDILVTHAQCDSYITKRHESIRCKGFDPDKITMTINQMIKELLNF